MIRVLRHYLPLRKALLVVSETVVLTGLVGLGMSSHLIGDIHSSVIANLAQEPMGPEEALSRCRMSAFLVSLLAQLAITLNELYDYRISSSTYERASRFVASAGSAIFVGGGAVALARFWQLDRILDFPGLTRPQLVQTLIFTLLIGFFVLYFWRHIFHFALGRWHFSQRVLILGGGETATALADEMNQRPYSGFEAIAMLPDDALHLANDQREVATTARVASGDGTSGSATSTAPRLELMRSLRPVSSSSGSTSSAAGGAPAKKKTENFVELVKELKIDEIVVALEDRRRRLPVEDLLRCRLEGIAVKEYEELYEQITGKISVAALRPSYLIFNPGFSRSPWGELAKRALDLVGAIIITALMWPVMLVVAVLVRMDSPGPALFKQERVGRDGESFTLLKFRSMRADAEKLSGPVWAQTNDPRITKIGSFMRKTRLDELPQLFNVLAGQMSLVGPRPERPVFVQELAAQIPYYDQRHVVKPGLTGWAQINYPYGNTIEDSVQKLQFDLFYIKYQSLLFDISILFNTVKTVLLRKGQ